jgi:hypothetical protein
MTNDELSDLVRKSAADLIEAARALGDKVTWSVNDKGRTAADQIAECALLSTFGAQTLAEKACPPMEMDRYNAAKAALAADPTAAMKALADNTEALSKAIRALNPEDHAHAVTMPWGNAMTLSEVALLIHWNNNYHQGQVNFIQTLV